MQTYPTFCVLTKDWISHRHKKYPAGTTFRKNTNIPSPKESQWYDFVIPGLMYGIVLIPYRIFFKLTESEMLMRKERERVRKEHMMNYERI